MGERCADTMLGVTRISVTVCVQKTMRETPRRDAFLELVRLKANNLQLKICKDYFRKLM